ncbi:MAG: arsenite methyltransferase [Rhodothermales bacterium]
MDTNESIKTMVREKYSTIVTSADKSEGCGCGCSSSTSDFNMIGEAYDKVEGYVEDADLGLGCGVPTEVANIKPGQTVLDLGSGAGLDVFTARSIVGDNGHVIGVDMTPEMIDKARKNTEKLGYKNVEFLLGDIEALPLEDNTIDVIISNCVLNLVPNKAKAFSELYRVLKPGAHFCVSDIVVQGEMPAAIQQAAELYVGCVSGAVEQAWYMQTIKDTGFQEAKILKSNVISIPEEVLQENLSTEEITAYHNSGMKVLSVTVSGVKPS